MNIYFLNTADEHTHIREALANYGQVLPSTSRDFLLADTFVIELSKPDFEMGYCLARAEQTRKPILCLCTDVHDVCALVRSNLILKEYKKPSDICKALVEFFR